MFSNLIVDTLRPYHFRGKLRLLEGMIPHRGERVARVFGYDMRIDLGEAIQRWIYLGAFEPQETAIVRRHLAAGMTFVDVGANVGYFSLLAASCVGPEGCVFSLEPSPYAFQRLEETVRSNGLSQVHAHHLGLSAEAGELALYLPPPEAGFHSPTMSASAGHTPVLVPVQRLDDCLDTWGVESVDLMKLDVEGHEPFVLRGASRALETGRIRAVLCEYNDYWLREQGSSPRVLHDMFMSSGFIDVHGAPDFTPGGMETRFLVHRSARAAS